MLVMWVLGESSMRIVVMIGIGLMVMFRVSGRIFLMMVFMLEFFFFCGMVLYCGCG